MALLRFAPSPTGYLHLGGLRTALFNHIYAKRLGGKWILRIEDTDATRHVPGAVDGIRHALDWAGLDYDYGPGREGPHSPYYQSERLDLYHLYAKRLLDTGHAYRCFCSPDQLAMTREKLARSGSNNTYDKKCLGLTEEEVARKTKAGEKSTVRINDGNLPTRDSATDIVFGAVSDSHASLPTDPILLKSDLFPTYHLASVVDDHEMGITHVLRGEEWLPSLPLHLDLYASLSLNPPQYGHLPILLNLDGTKMSKRNGDLQVADFIRTGWEPEAVLNWLALAGWGVNHSESPSTSPSIYHHQAPDSTTVMTLEEITTQFDPASLTHRRNIMDPHKLLYLNKHHLQRLWSTPEGLDRLAHRVHDLVKEAYPTSPFTTVDYLKTIILTLESRLVNIYDIPKLAPYLFQEPDLSSDEAKALKKGISENVYKLTIQAVHSALSQIPATAWGGLNMAKILSEENDKLGIKQKVYMTTLRHALSGMKTGPGVPDIIKALGKDRTLGRLKS